MAIQLKPLNISADKFARNTNSAGQSYKDGISNPRRDWATQTAGAQANWAAGVTTAVTNGTFAKRVQAAGTQTWQSGALNKGAAVYASRTSASSPKWAKNFQPFADALAAVTLGPRGPKGENYGRVQTVGEALRAVRVRLKSGV